MAEQSAPLTHSPAPAPRGRARRRGRPTFGILVAVAIVARLGRDVVQRTAISRYGPLGFAVVGAAVILVVVLWRAGLRHRARTRGGSEFTPERVTEQIAASGVAGPAFPEDGTLLGASLLVVNQHAKILEVNTDYAVFGSTGQHLGAIRQIGQSRAKSLARILTSLDQFFTHHFEILDTSGRPVLRLTRPRKIFLTKLHVFDGDDRFVGTIRQQNVFWKIRFEMLDYHRQVVGHMRAQNLRAWDFHIYNHEGHIVATIVKSWEGWGHTFFTRADHYVVRIHKPLADPLRCLAVAAALAADVALKQDARGIT